MLTIMESLSGKSCSHVVQCRAGVTSCVHMLNMVLFQVQWFVSMAVVRLAAETGERGKHSSTLHRD